MIQGVCFSLTENFEFIDRATKQPISLDRYLFYPVDLDIFGGAASQYIGLSVCLPACQFKLALSSKMTGERYPYG